MLKIRDGPGNAKALISVSTIEDRTRRGIRQAFFGLGDDLLKELSDQMLEKNKTGRIYIRKTRSGARRKHKSSGPGQTPANRTGTLRKSRGYQLKGSDQMEFGYREEYGKFLESGTKKMSARPGLKNTVDATQKTARNRFTASIRRELTKL